MTPWRLVPASRADTAFSGFGAREYGGRWSPKGYAVVYLAEHLSLAALETYVHLPPEARGMTFSAYRVVIPDDIEPIEWDELPDDWRTSPAPASTQEMGRAWLDEGAGCLLAVPSVVVPQERNLVVNLSHPDWQRVRIADPEPFSFDPRMR